MQPAGQTAAMRIKTVGAGRKYSLKQSTGLSGERIRDAGITFLLPAALIFLFRWVQALLLAMGAPAGVASTTAVYRPARQRRGRR